MGWPAVVSEWGTSATERAAPYACDALIDGPVIVAYRGVDVDAPPSLAYRWICQQRVAPYSYDWIDNLGRRSPQQLTPGLEQLAIGQRIAVLFRVAAFEPDRSVTMVTRPGPLGHCASTYRVDPVAGDRCRIVVKIILAVRSRTPLGALMRLGFAPGDLVMMRRQLLNFKALAERDARAAPAAR